MTVSFVTRRDLATRSAAALAGLQPVLATAADGPSAHRALSVVGVGAPPDDPESGCGGTLARYAERGHRVTVIYLTRGEAGIRGKSHQEATTIRTAEAEQACRILGASPVFTGQIDGATEVNRARAQALAALIKAEHSIETTCVPGQVGLDLLEDPAAEQGLLLDQVAAMAGPELQRRVGRVARGLLQAEAVDRGAEDPRLGVGPIGLGVVRGGLAVMAGDGGVDDAGVEAGGGEGALDWAVIAAGLLDGDDQVAEAVLGGSPPELGEGGVGPRAGVLDGGEGDEDAAVEVGERPGGAGLGAVDGDDAEVLGSDGLDARGEQAFGLAEVLAAVGAAAPGSRAGLHGWGLRKRPRVY
jgi:hypothetical protein